jgi:hypothetical protein
MKWYNYKNIWLDVDKCYGVILIEHQLRFAFYGSGDDYIEITYKSTTERDVEFAKIKLLMGIEDFTSRCC